MKASACTLPVESLLQAYAAKGDFVDSYSAPAEGAVSLAQFVTAFYRTRLFRLERLILKHALGKGSADKQVEALAAAEVDRFAAWTVEARQPDQLLMCDFQGRTRSWFMVNYRPDRKQSTLYFGSAVVARVNPITGEQSMGGGFKALLGFHKLYSKALLNSAQNSLRKNLK